MWEKLRLLLERDWEKHNRDITIEIPQYEQIIKSVLSMKHFNYLKQFMIRLFRNNLYFKNVTSKFAESGILCNSCKSAPEDRIHFFKCKIHSEIMHKLFTCFTHIKLLKTIPNLEPFLHNTTLPLNHPTNLIYISTLKFMYNLRCLKKIPTLTSVKHHVSQFVETAIKMYPDDSNWIRCHQISYIIETI